MTRAGIGASEHAVTTRPKKLPLHPAHPERICWGCDKYCAADDLRCGNGSDRAQHPVEILGDDWLEHGLDAANAEPGSSDAHDPSDANRATPATPEGAAHGGHESDVAEQRPRPAETP